MLRIGSRRIQRLEPQAAYALWAPTYPPRPHNLLMKIEQQTVLSFLPSLSGRMALDAGCGTGRYLHALEQRGARVIGVDLSAAMLGPAKEVSANIVRGDLCALPIARMSIDLVVCGLALGDVRHLGRAVGELTSVLKPGGDLIYSVVHPSGADEGWTRTFEANGRMCAVSGYWHSAAEHREACENAGLHIEAWHEPAITAGGPPVALVIKARQCGRAR